MKKQKILNTSVSFVNFTAKVLLLSALAMTFSCLRSNRSEELSINCFIICSNLYLKKKNKVKANLDDQSF